MSVLSILIGLIIFYVICISTLIKVKGNPHEKTIEILDKRFEQLEK